MSKNYVKIGDTITILNTQNNQTEKYTIVPTYHEQKIIGTDVTRGENFGRAIYKDIITSESDVENGIILSESDFAKKLIGSRINSKFTLLNDELNEVTYQIIDIKKTNLS